MSAVESVPTASESKRDNINNYSGRVSSLHSHCESIKHTDRSSSGNATSSDVSRSSSNGNNSVDGSSYSSSSGCFSYAKVCNVATQSSEAGCTSSNGSGSSSSNSARGLRWVKGEEHKHEPPQQHQPLSLCSLSRLVGRGNMEKAVVSSSHAGRKSQPIFERRRKRYRTVSWKYKKSIGVFASFVFLCNQILAPGLTSMPLTLIDHGWMPSLLTNVLFCFLSSLCSLLLLRSVTLIEGNSNFDERFEYSATLRHFLTPFHSDLPLVGETVATSAHAAAAVGSENTKQQTPLKQRRGRLQSTVAGAAALLKNVTSAVFSSAIRLFLFFALRRSSSSPVQAEAAKFTGGGMDAVQEKRATAEGEKRNGSSEQSRERPALSLSDASAATSAADFASPTSPLQQPQQQKEPEVSQQQQKEPGVSQQQQKEPAGFAFGNDGGAAAAEAASGLQASSLVVQADAATLAVPAQVQTPLTAAGGAAVADGKEPFEDRKSGSSSTEAEPPNAAASFAASSSPISLDSTVTDLSETCQRKQTSLAEMLFLVQPQQQQPLLQQREKVPEQQLAIVQDVKQPQPAQRFSLFCKKGLDLSALFLFPLNRACKQVRAQCSRFYWHLFACVTRPPPLLPSSFPRLLSMLLHLNTFLSTCSGALLVAYCIDCLLLRLFACTLFLPLLPTHVSSSIEGQQEQDVLSGETVLLEVAHWLGAFAALLLQPLRSIFALLELVVPDAAATAANGILTAVGFVLVSITAAPAACLAGLMLPQLTAAGSWLTTLSRALAAGFSQEQQIAAAYGVSWLPLVYRLPSQHHIEEVFSGVCSVSSTACVSAAGAATLLHRSSSPAVDLIYSAFAASTTSAATAADAASIPCLLPPFYSFCVSHMGITMGYIITAAICLHLAAKDLQENSQMQLLSFGAILAAVLQITCSAVAMLVSPSPTAAAAGLAPPHQLIKSGGDQKQQAAALVAVNAKSCGRAQVVVATNPVLDAAAAGPPSARAVTTFFPVVTASSPGLSVKAAEGQWTQGLSTATPTGTNTATAAAKQDPGWAASSSVSLSASSTTPPAVFSAFPATAAAVQLPSFIVRGGGMGALVATYVDAYSFSNALPSWANEVKDNVPVAQTIFMSTCFACVIYFIFGYLCAAAFPAPSASSNVLAAMLPSSNSRIAAACICFFHIFALFPNIVTSQISRRYDLLNMAICLDKSSAFFVSSTLPWLLYWVLTFSPLFAVPSALLTLLSNMLLNFAAPALVYVYALHATAATELHRTAAAAASMAAAAAAAETPRVLLQAGVPEAARPKTVVENGRTFFLLSSQEEKKGLHVAPVNILMAEEELMPFFDHCPVVGTTAQPPPTTATALTNLSSALVTTIPPTDLSVTSTIGQSPHFSAEVAEGGLQNNDIPESVMQLKNSSNGDYSTVPPSSPSQFFLCEDAEAEKKKTIINQQNEKAGVHMKTVTEATQKKEGFFPTTNRVSSMLLKPPIPPPSSSSSFFAHSIRSPMLLQQPPFFDLSSQNDIKYHHQAAAASIATTSTATATTKNLPLTAPIATTNTPNTTILLTTTTTTPFSTYTTTTTTTPPSTTIITTTPVSTTETTPINTEKTTTTATNNVQPGGVCTPQTTTTTTTTTTIPVKPTTTVATIGGRVSAVSMRMVNERKIKDQGKNEEGETEDEGLAKAEGGSSFISNSSWCFAGKRSNRKSSNNCRRRPEAEEEEKEAVDSIESTTVGKSLTGLTGVVGGGIKRAQSQLFEISTAGAASTKRQQQQQRSAAHNYMAPPPTAAGGRWALQRGETRCCGSLLDHPTLFTTVDTAAVANGEGGSYSGRNVSTSVADSFKKTEQQQQQSTYHQPSHHFLQSKGRVAGAVAGGGGARSREVQRQLRTWLEEYSRQMPQSEVALLLQQQQFEDQQQQKKQEQQSLSDEVRRRRQVENLWRRRQVFQADEDSGSFPAAAAETGHSNNDSDGYHNSNSSDHHNNDDCNKSCNNTTNTSSSLELDRKSNRSSSSRCGDHHQDERMRSCSPVILTTTTTSFNSSSSRSSCSDKGIDSVCLAVSSRWQTRSPPTDSSAGASPRAAERGDANSATRSEIGVASSAAVCGAKTVRPPPSLAVNGALKQPMSAPPAATLSLARSYEAVETEKTQTPAATTAAAEKIDICCSEKERKDHTTTTATTAEEASSSLCEPINFSSADANKSAEAQHRLQAQQQLEFQLQHAQQMMQVSQKGGQQVQLKQKHGHEALEEAPHGERDLALMTQQQQQQQHSPREQQQEEALQQQADTVDSAASSVVLRNFERRSVRAPRIDAASIALQKRRKERQQQEGRLQRQQQPHGLLQAVTLKSQPLAQQLLQQHQQQSFEKHLEQPQSESSQNGFALVKQQRQLQTSQVCAERVGFLASETPAAVLTAVDMDEAAAVDARAAADHDHATGTAADDADAAAHTAPLRLQRSRSSGCLLCLEQQPPSHTSSVILRLNEKQQQLASHQLWQYEVETPLQHQKRRGRQRQLHNLSKHVEQLQLQRTQHEEQKQAEETEQQETQPKDDGGAEQCGFQTFATDQIRTTARAAPESRNGDCKERASPLNSSSTLGKRRRVAIFTQNVSHAAANLSAAVITARAKTAAAAATALRVIREAAGITTAAARRLAAVTTGVASAAAVRAAATTKTTTTALARTISVLLREKFLSFAKKAIRRIVLLLSNAWDSFLLQASRAYFPLLILLSNTLNPLYRAYVSPVVQRLLPLCKTFSLLLQAYLFGPLSLLMQPVVVAPCRAVNAVLATILRPIVTAVAAEHPTTRRFATAIDRAPAGADEGALHAQASPRVIVFPWFANAEQHIVATYMLLVVIVYCASAALAEEMWAFLDPLLLYACTAGRLLFTWLINNLLQLLSLLPPAAATSLLAWAGQIWNSETQSQPQAIEGGEAEETGLWSVEIFYLLLLLLVAAGFPMLLLISPHRKLRKHLQYQFEQRGDFHFLVENICNFL